MADVKEIQTLIKKRGIIKGQLIRFSNQIKSKTDNINLFEIRARFERIQALWQEFNNVQNQLEVIDEENDHTEERTNFEEAYLDITAYTSNLLESLTLSVVKESSSRSSSGGSSQHNEDILENVSESGFQNFATANPNLPKLNLPEFYGSYDKWLQFADTYKSLIHNNSSLSNIQKYWYLKSCIKGEASNILISLEVSEDNYEKAWDLLCQRYENKKIIIQTHLRALMDIQSHLKESHVSIRSIVDSTRQHLRALESLKLPVDKWDTLLIYIISQKLDAITQREWEQHSISLETETPTYEQFTAFLNKKCQLLENLNKKHIPKIQNKKSHDQSISSTHVVTSTPGCIFCNKDHPIFQCNEFLNLAPQERLNKVRCLKACTNCLRKGHSSGECRTKYLCRKCNLKHNTLLHLGKVTNTSKTDNSSSSNSNGSDPILSESTQNLSLTEKSISRIVFSDNNDYVMLSTATVLISDKYGHYHQCRALLDNGSQSNFITKELFHKLKLDSNEISHSVQGFGSSVSSIFCKTITNISSPINSFSVKNVSFLVTEEIIKNFPSISFNATFLQIPSNIVLADETFNKKSKIDMLIGAPIFWSLICVGQIRLSNGSTILQKTTLGWILSGPLSLRDASDSRNSLCNLIIRSDDDLGEKLEKFWRVEECQPSTKLSKEEVECEELFSKTTFRDSQGRFVVNLPVKDSVTELGDSYNVALKMFHATERKLNKNPVMKEKYIQFMNEYEALGHMSRLNSLDLKNAHNKINYYLPHHGVIKDDSPTTKLRVVFNGSAKTSSGLSLNDVLRVGPKLQEDLFILIVRFRIFRYAFTGDVEKMYRMVYVHNRQCDLQRILWRSNETEEILTYVLKTLTYGTAPAAYLAIKSLRQTAIENKEQFPEACYLILSCFYVDNLLGGSDSIENSKRLISEVISILKSAGFNLRQWVASDDEILENLENKSNSTQKFISDDKTIKTLGLLWNSEEDVFQYSVNIKAHVRVTKRSIMSVIAQIFDPMGLLGPSVLIAKLIMQKLWQTGLDWDESVPMDLHESWLKFLDQIILFNDIKVPRYILCHNAVNIQLHFFSDASQNAYGACCYLRSTDNFGKINIRLVSAKSKVAPLKTLTLPRLELCGALLAVRLSQQIMHVKVDSIFYWVDSTIVLSWIAIEACKLNTFVANRISEIQRLTNLDQWKHISGNSNPADHISRGLYPKDLLTCKSWWSGPAFLAHSQSEWPQGNFVLSEPPEVKKNTTMVMICQSVGNEIINSFSSFTKLTRVFAYCIRFGYNARFKSFRRTGPLLLQELDRSSVIICSMIQRHYFSTEIQALKCSNLPSTSKIKSLNPFLDKDELIRVGGRIQNSSVLYNQKHPILLPSSSHFTDLIILHEHKRLLHAGVQSTLAAVRLKFWPINGKNAVRKVLRTCIDCFKINPVVSSYQMGNLPKSRLIPQRPFFVTGIDYAGPFYIKDGKTRNRKIIKCYLCIFVCFVTKAAHLELASDLSSEAFINCLKRFVSRRGVCAEIYSDNGTNFVGTERELSSLMRDLDSNNKLGDFLATNKITWHFSPPQAPNFGGLWEACVKSAKHHLKRILRNTSHTFEGLYTIITQVEAVLNSRPLTPFSNDPNDLSYSTPSHFLIGEPLTALPQTDVSDVAPNRLSHYKLLQQQYQHFWKRWQSEYLSTLQERSKWHKQFPNLEVGTLVILKDDNLAPLYWKLGRVIETFPGQDGVVRVVNVKTLKGVVRRSVTKICVLPIN